MPAVDPLVWTEPDALPGLRVKMCPWLILRTRRTTGLQARPERDLCSPVLQGCFYCSKGQLKKNLKKDGIGKEKEEEEHVTGPEVTAAPKTVCFQLCGNSPPAPGPSMRRAVSCVSVFCVSMARRRLHAGEHMLLNPRLREDASGRHVSLLLFASMKCEQK